MGIINKIFGKTNNTSAITEDTIARIPLQTEKNPIEIIYEGQKVDEVIDRFCTVAIPKVPLLTTSQVIALYNKIKNKWGCELYKGTINDLENVLIPKMNKDLENSMFTYFSVTNYYNQGCAQVESHFGGTFKGYRAWRTDKEIFFCYS
jgi:hypothetical protein